MRQTRLSICGHAMHRHAAFIAIVGTGFAAGIAQILILRECLVLCYGNELSTGLVLACWLSWTALGSAFGGKWSSRFSSVLVMLGLGLLILAALLPLTLLWIRAARPVWSIPLGEVVSPALMLLVSFSATSGFCLLSGFMFALCWSAHLHMTPAADSRPIVIYLGEALGAAVGGLVCHFVLLPHISTFQAACAAALVLMGVALCLMGATLKHRRVSAIAALLIMIGCATIVLPALRSSALDQISHRWQWGPGLVAVRDTPHNNLALLESESQFSLFGNGLWFFSIPDPKTTEYAVHLAMLQHPDPRQVLLIGGGNAALVAEILKHPQVNQLDVVEPDPAILDLLAAHLPDNTAAAMRDLRVRRWGQDARLFVSQTGRTYDVVLSNLGDPLNAEFNRYYTVEYFRKIKARLNPDGIFSFAVSAADIPGPVQLRFLRSLLDTARHEFPQVMLLLIDSARFLAGNGAAPLTADPSALQARIRERSLDLQYVREYYLFDHLNPMRLGHLDKLLAQSPSQRLNKDFIPLCYFNSLLLWVQQLNPGLAKTLAALTGVGQRQLWIALTGLLLLLAVLSRLGSPGGSAPMLLSVSAMGGTQLSFEIILLLSFQILTGFVYQQLALIVTFFMVGVVLGAGVEPWLIAQSHNRRWWLIAVQVAFATYLAAVYQTIMGMHGANFGAMHLTLTSIVFAVMAGLGGLLGGLHFALAVKLSAPSVAASARTAGRLYAVDLMGAVMGALATSLYLIPAYGVATTLFVLTLVNLGAALSVGAARR